MIHRLPSRKRRQWLTPGSELLAGLARSGVQRGGWRNGSPCAAPLFQVNSLTPTRRPIRKWYRQCTPARIPGQVEQAQATLLTEQNLELSTSASWNAARRLGLSPEKPCTRPSKTGPTSQLTQTVESYTAFASTTLAEV